MILVTKTSDQMRQRGHTLSTCAILTCVCVCVFIGLHITATRIDLLERVYLLLRKLQVTAQSGLITYSFYATAAIIHLGFTFREHIFG